MRSTVTRLIVLLDSASRNARGRQYFGQNKVQYRSFNFQRFRPTLRHLLLSG